MSVVTVNKWGNSAAVRLPGEALEQARLRLGEKVNVVVRGDEIVISAVRPSVRLRLADLLAKSPRSPAKWVREDAWSDDPAIGRELV